MLQLMMDSLRYWLTEMHADGFRFDLAPTLARQEGAFDKVSAFLDMCSQDPVVCRAKLVAEPRMSARWTATTWAGSRRCGGSGTASTGTRCVTSGAATLSPVTCRSGRSGALGTNKCSSWRILAAGPAFVQNLCRGHYDIAIEVFGLQRFRLAFDDLVLAI
jgi:hypothetical protein